MKNLNCLLQPLHFYHFPTLLLNVLFMFPYQRSVKYPKMRAYFRYLNRKILSSLNPTPLLNCLWTRDTYQLAKKINIMINFHYYTSISMWSPNKTNSNAITSQELLWNTTYTPIPLITNYTKRSAVQNAQLPQHNRAAKYPFRSS